MLPYLANVIHVEVMHYHMSHRQGSLKTKLQSLCSCKASHELNIFTAGPTATPLAGALLFFFWSHELEKKAAVHGHSVDTKSDATKFGQRRKLEEHGSRLDLNQILMQKWEQKY